jgi:hypothetical protein
VIVAVPSVGSLAVSVPLTVAIATMWPFSSTRNWVTFAVRLPLTVTV